MKSTSPPPDASGTARGLVNLVAQTFAGVKTFTSALIASAGIQLGSLWNTNGTGASDVCLKVGTNLPDVSVNPTAQLWALVTGIGGTEVTRAWYTKSAGTQFNLRNGASSRYVFDSEDATGALSFRINAISLLSLLSTGVCRSGYGFDINPAFGAFLSLQLHSDGRVNQRGTDSSATPGAATADRPIGKNAIAAGASSVVVTNNLVTAASVIFATPHARDATCKELIAVAAAGSFTVSGSANATATLPFSWEVKGLL